MRSLHKAAKKLSFLNNVECTHICKAKVSYIGKAFSMYSWTSRESASLLNKYKLDFAFINSKRFRCWFIISKTFACFWKHCDNSSGGGPCGDQVLGPSGVRHTPGGTVCRRHQLHTPPPGHAYRYGVMAGWEQCFGSVLIWYGSGSSILGSLPIRIQGFDDQKLEKFTTEN
jgi:hypothetical protein